MCFQNSGGGILLFLITIPKKEFSKNPMEFEGECPSPKLISLGEGTQKK